ncbi:MAG TPA: flagellar basal-body rod protein FlgG [Alphaproteobacteria bacterium]|nr:flagellar basal-body rod protein FlgG [Alphaproteobacteria bacterium]
MRALQIGATGMQAQQLNVEVISNNIANMTTTGYKLQRPAFQDLLYENVTRPGSQSSDIGTIVPSGIQLGSGVRAAAVYRVDTQGDLQQTGNQLDLAVTGQGYFQIELPNGDTAYTRDGSFQLNANGQVVTGDGYVVKPGLVIPKATTAITVNTDGQMFAKVDGTTNPVSVGQVELATFANNAGLEATGNNLFLETPASGVPVTGAPGALGFGTITQGSLESSNVNIVSEVTNLIAAQRAYEMNSKVIQTSDQMLNDINQMH